MKSRIILILIFLQVFGFIIYSAEVPIKSQAEMMIKIISMDRNFGRYADPVEIGVSSQGILNQLNNLKSFSKINGRNFIAVKMNSVNDLGKFKVAYIGKNWSGKYSIISKKAIENNILLCCTEENYVAAGGGAISFRVVNNKAKLVVNVNNAKNQGSSFPSGFLRTTIIVD